MSRVCLTLSDGDRFVEEIVYIERALRLHKVCGQNVVESSSGRIEQC